MKSLKIVSVCFSVILFMLVMKSCSTDDLLLEEQMEENVQEQEDVQSEDGVKFGNLDFDYSENDLNEEFDDNVAALGRVLFYDKSLSLNERVSCASCHKQEFAFSDNVSKSEGFLNGSTITNTPNLINVKFNDTFFWDSRTDSFGEAVTMPIFDHNEMGLSKDELINRIRNLDYYKPLFEDAFGSVDVELSKIELALTEFVGSIISIDSKFDQIAGSLDLWDTEELNGALNFLAACNNCHQILPGVGGEVGESSSSSSMGPYMGSGDNPPGRFQDTTDRLVDIGLPNVTISHQRVRIPSLRNITSTAPYMHDGRFATLEEVLDHYSEDVEDRNSVDQRIHRNLKLDDSQKASIIRFLELLSDDKIETDVKHSDPFL